LGNQPPKEAQKPPKAPLKYVTFTAHDSRSIETAFQKLGDEEDTIARESINVDDYSEDIGSTKQSRQTGDKDQPNTETDREGRVKVAVNEDYLFDVDVERRELAPVYWLGPVYETRRGTWFYQEGSSLRPCDENLATQIEEGYLKSKPWRNVKPELKKSELTSAAKKRLSRGRLDEPQSGDKSANVTPRASLENLKASERSKESLNPSSASLPHYDSQRLFGAYMNSTITYQDATTAWFQTDDFYSRMSSTVYERFAGGAHLGGTKIVRGYTDNERPKESKIDADKKGEDVKTGTKDDGGPDLSRAREKIPASLDEESSPIAPESGARARLERQISSFVSSGDAENDAEEARQRDEEQMQEDYADDEDGQGREIDHLLLVTHGIGQRLGLRMDSVNFVHDVNVLRKTLKAVYNESADLQALNSEVDKLPKNCRVQVLPVCWRHLLDFPKQGRKQHRESDIGAHDDFGDEDEYPSLQDITVEGVPAVRALISDLALDILLYQSAYREHISTICLNESNRIYKLFCERNPNFKGKVSLVGHSLGSAIFFDILCRQRDEEVRRTSSNKMFYHERPGTQGKSHKGANLALDFDVENFFCLGSPIGLFQMLKGRTIAARHTADAFPAESPLNPDYKDDPFFSPSSLRASQEEATSAVTHLPFSVSSPKCAQLFNIFHPTDPISYRIEPLISPAMASLKPQPLPYTKKGIFGAPMGQGIAGIGNRVSQTVSGFWSSVSSGIASSILNRSLGFTGEEGGPPASQQTSLTVGAPVAKPPIQQLSAGAGTNITSGGVIPSVSSDSEIAIAAATEERKRRQLVADTLTAEQAGEQLPTLIDGEIETLYSGFQKRRKSHQGDMHLAEGGLGNGDDVDGLEWEEAEEKSRRLRREEQKVRALNDTGRVDFSIQE
jgi:DDHD domain